MTKYNSEKFIEINLLYTQLSGLKTSADLELVKYDDYVEIYDKTCSSSPQLKFDVYGNVEGIIYCFSDSVSKFLNILLETKKVINWDSEKQRGFYRDYSLEEAKINMLEHIVWELQNKENDSTNENDSDDQSLKDDIETIRDDIQGIRDDVSSLESKMEDVQGYDFDDLCRRVDRLEEYSVEDVCNKVDDLENSINDLESKLDEFKDEVDLNDFNDMKDKLEQLENVPSDLDDLKEEINRLKSQIQQYENGLFSGVSR